MSLLSSAAEPDTTTQSLKACARIQSQAKRIACLERLASEVSSIQDTEVADADRANRPPQEAAAPEEITTDTDQFGAERTEKSERGPVEEMRSVVLSCEKNAYGKYYFRLSNGQTWLQTGSRRKNWRECSFAITISKDRLGYTLVMEGEKGRVRVTRLN